MKLSGFVLEDVLVSVLESIRVCVGGCVIPATTSRSALLLTDNTQWPMSLAVEIELGTDREIE